MRSIGIVREVDELGRVVIPIETRKLLLIELGDPMEFFVDDNMIMMRKYNATACLFCSSAERTHFFKGKFVCSACLANLLPGESLVSPERERDDTQMRTEPPASQTLNEEENDGETATAEERRRRGRTADAVERLKELRQLHPASNQKMLAELMGISQGRISQLMKLIDQERQGTARSGVPAAEETFWGSPSLQKEGFCR